MMDGIVLWSLMKMKLRGGGGGGGGVVDRGSRDRRGRRE